MRAGAVVYIAHPFDRPEQVHRSWSGGGKDLAQALKFGRIVNLLQLPSTKRDAHGGGHANCWRAADHHVLDRSGHAPIVAIGTVDLPVRQETLVEHRHRAILPLDSKKTVHAPTWGANNCTPVAGFQVATV